MSQDNDEDDKGAKGGAEQLKPNLSEDRPLDSLMPEMRGGKKGGGEDPHAGAPGQVGAIHPRVLEVGLEEGREWTLACWEDCPPVEFGEQFGQLVEATLLREASRIPAWEADEQRKFTGMRVLTFDSIRQENRRILRQLGFVEGNYVADEYEERMDAWRREANAAGMQPPMRPVSVWHVPVAEFDAERAEALDAIEATMLEKLGGEVWGETPGGMSKLLARQLAEHFDIDAGLDPESLAAMAGAVTPDALQAIRWMRPVFFQALCDFVGVLLHGKYGLQVQWGMCEPNDQGIVPPPMFRDPEGPGRGAIPVGREVLRWCVLPVDDADQLPDLEDEVAALARTVEENRS